jgi:hypothetical protein
MALSGRFSSAFSSASCLRANCLEVAFFIRSPFMRRSFPGTDHAGHRFVASRFGFRPRVNHEQQYRSNQADRVPAIAVRVRIRLGGMKRVIEHAHRRFERQAMFGAVCRRLPRIHVQRNTSPRSYKYVATPRGGQEANVGDGCGTSLGPRRRSTSRCPAAPGEKCYADAATGRYGRVSARTRPATRAVRADRSRS